MHLQLLKQYKSVCKYRKSSKGLGATRVNWTTRENMPAPESAAEHAQMTRHIRTELAEAEEALEKMPARATRASKQLEDKVYMISVLHDWQSSNLYQHTRWEDKEQTTLETQQILKSSNQYLNYCT